MTAAVRQQTSAPLQSGGHEFIQLTSLNLAAYAASRLDSDRLTKQKATETLGTQPDTSRENDALLLDNVYRLLPSFTTEHSGLPDSLSPATLAINADITYNMLYRALCDSAA
eukprot:GFKZ01007896.1.p4 GENE.GFKZ01007896.1~~GFKZ01007896.1.p4  ORF type:complete len:112 (-),score=11.52 GFKZ01007896.1:326-661(-)